MKYICTFKAFFHGRTFIPGETVDMTEAEAKLDNVKSSFKPAEPAAAPVKPSKANKDELSDDEMKRRLMEMGVNFPSRIAHDALLKLYNDQMSANKEAGK